MKPGSLVMFELRVPLVLGVILREFGEESDKSNVWLYPKAPLSRQRWWEILCEDGKIILEAEGNLKRI